MNQSILATSESPAANDRSWQIWGLVKQELLFLCWALMEVAILTPIALTVMRWSQYWSEGLVLLWLLLLVLLPFNLVRLLSALGVPRNHQWRIILAALVITLLISWRGLLYAPRPILDLTWLGEFFGRAGELANPLWARDLTVFLFTLLAWWRGLRLAQMTPSIYQIGLRLRAGGLLLLPIAFFLRASGHLWGVTPYILLYFLAGLTAVALIRAEQIERERSGFAASLTPRWVLTIFATSLLVVATAGLAAALISGDIMALFTGRLAPLWGALVATAAVSLSTVIFLLTPAINLLTALITWIIETASAIFASFGLRLSTEALPSLEALQPFSDLTRGENPVALDLPPTAGRTITIAVMLTVAAIITFALTRLFRQPQTSARSGSGQAAVRTTDGSGPGLAGRIMRRLGWINRWRTAASIQRIYRDMCRAAAGAGYPRGSAETPYEYLHTLCTLWPDNFSETALITEAYVRVRYGEIPETDDEMRAIQSAWQQLSGLQPAADDSAMTLE